MATTNKGRRVFFCSTAQNADLDQSGFEGLTWIEVLGVGNVGESGTQTNIVSYDELATDVTQKNKGISNAGDPTIECSRRQSDAGQIALRAAGLTKDHYALKMIDDDAPAGSVGTTYYNRGVVVGPIRPNGRNEDFNLETFTLGCDQREVVVAPTALAVPVNILPPAVSGVPDVSTGFVYAWPGTYTNLASSYLYQWQRDVAGNGVFSDIAAATADTYDPQAADLNNRLRVGTKGVNGTGPSAAFTYSNPTPATVA